ncbi:MAG: T9SS type A sorting domain-containing protein [Bacteroidota bacterium]
MKKEHVTKVLFVMIIFLGLRAQSQQIRNYIFAPTMGTFTPLTGAFTVAPIPTGTFSAVDEGAFNAIQIGFPFYYMGKAYTVLSATTNGRISLGASALTLNDAGNVMQAGIATDVAGRPTIAPLWEDLDKGTFSYKISGTPGSRTFTAQWLNWAWDYASLNPAISFQCILHEATGQIQFVYRQESGAVINSSTGAGIGITAVGTGVGTHITVTKAAATATDTTTITVADTISQKPATGQIFSFTPPTITGSGLLFSGVTDLQTASATLNWVHSSPGGTTCYGIYVSTNAGVSYDFVTSTQGLIYTATGLTPNTSYIYKIVPVTEGYLDEPNAIFSPTITTLACSPITGTKSVGPTGNYPSLKAATDSMAVYGISGNVILELQSGYTGAGEVYPLVIADYRSVSCASPTATLTLRPEAATTGITITSSSIDATLVINGADYFVLDGRPGGVGTTGVLTIENTGIGTASNAIRLQNDAIGNTLRYLTVRGSNTGTGVGAGAIFIGTTTGLLGNDSNTISNCNISKSGANTLAVGIASSGLSAAVQNSRNTINNNNIYGFSNSGVLVTATGNGGGWNISNNSFYDTAVSTATVWTGVNFIPGTTSLSTANIINDNFIGGSAPQLGGAVWSNTAAVTYRGIICTVNAGQATTISKNKIGRISFSGATVQSFGINPTGGTILVDSNIIDSMLSTANIDFIAINSTTAADITISNNTITNLLHNNVGTAGGAKGIFVGTASINTLNITNNTIKNLISNAATTGTTSTAPVYGIAVTASSPNQFITNNKIGNGYAEPLSMTSTLTGGRMNGIVVTAGINTIQGNTINGLISTTAATGTTAANASINGILCSSASNGNVIQNNSVRSILLSGAAVASQVNGIAVSSGATTILNNSLYGIRTTGNSASTSTSATLNGIDYAGGSTAIITSNVIDSMMVATSAASQCNGIVISGNTGNNLLSNTIRNIFSNSTLGTGSTPSIVGINNQSSIFNQLVSQNTINRLVNISATGTPTVAGIVFSGSTTVVGNNSVISRNTINTLQLQTSAVGTLEGIILAAGNANCMNNMIRLGIDSAGIVTTAAYNMYGIRSVPTTFAINTIYHNSIYIAGAPSTGAATTACFNLPSTQTTSFVDIRNNIFQNAMNPTGGTGKNYTIKTNSITNVKSNYNILFTATNGSNFIGAVSTTDYTALKGIGSWTSATLQDAQSGSVNPGFILPAGTYTTVNMHLQTTNPAEGMGDTTVTGVAEDYDGTARVSSSIDIGADAATFTLLADSIAPIAFFTGFSNTGSLTNRSLNAVIYDAKGVDMGNLPRIYYKRNAAGSFTSRVGSLVGGTAKNGTWSFTIDYSDAVMSGLVPNDTVHYYVIAQDSAVNIASSPLWANASSTSSIVTHPTTPNSYIITLPLSTTLMVGSGQTYASLTQNDPQGVFYAINNGVLQGNTDVLITSDITESGAVSLNQWLEIGGGVMGNYGYILRIRPDANTTRVLSGAVAQAMIRLTGADNVLISGVAPSGVATDTSLILRNTNAANPVVLCTNDASNNTFNNVIIESGNTAAASAAVFFTATTLTTGNDNNTFNGCVVRNNTLVPGSTCANAFRFDGAVGKENNNITINNCLIYNWTSNGIQVNNGNGNNFKITNNSFYMTGFVPTTAQTAINFLPGTFSNFDTISNNYIGGQEPLAAGATWVNSGAVAMVGISVIAGSNFGTHISGNTIQNISQTSATAGIFTGINISTNGAHNVINNTIGHASVANSIVSAGTGIMAGIITSASGNMIITNNTISNLTNTNTTGTGVGIRGINVTTASNMLNVSNNTLTNFTISGLNANTLTNAGLQGIGVSSASINQTISNNTIDNFKSLGLAVTSVIGIYATAGQNVINGNTVTNMFTNSTSAGTTTGAAMIGIVCSSVTQNQTINNNQVRNLSYYNATPVASTMYGIQVTSPSVTINNNSIINLKSVSTKTVTLANGGNLSAIIGLSYANATTPQVNTISNNIIHTLEDTNSVTASAVSIVGLFYSGAGAAVSTDNNITRNFIHSFKLSTLGAGIMQGIHVGGSTNATAATFANNMVRIGIDSAGLAYSGPYAVTGIVQSGSAATARFTGTCNYYHNSVYVGGAPATGSSLTASFETVGEVNSQFYLVLKNNIFFNAVSNTGTATGKNHIVRVFRQIYNVATNNIYFYNGVGGMVGGYTAVITDFVNLTGNGGWNQVAAIDYNTAFVNPQFINPTGTATTLDLHLLASNPAEGAGDPAISTLVGVDFDGVARSSGTPADIGADGGAFTVSSDAFPPTITYTPLTNSGSTSTRVLAGVNITDAGGIPTTGANAPRLYYSKDGVSFFSVAPTSFVGTATNATFLFTFNYTALGGVTAGDNISYYVIAQDNAGNILSANPYAVASNVNTVSVQPIIMNSYNIYPAIPANTIYKVGVGQTYTSLTNLGGLFEFLNSRTLAGNVSVRITSSINESGLIGLNELSDTNAIASAVVTIQPDSAIITELILSGNSSSGLIKLDGADRIKISGIPVITGIATDKKLRFRNTNNAAATIFFFNDATANRVHNCIIEGGNVSPSAAAGVIQFGPTAFTQGNDNDTISNCVIRNDITQVLPAGVPVSAINSSGSDGKPNSGNVIMNNEILNWSGFGLNIAASNFGNGNNWVITGNSFYNNLSVNPVTAQIAINFIPGLYSTGNTINGNFIGGQAANCTGAAWINAGNVVFTPIVVNVGLGNATQVDANRIQNINLTNLNTGNRFIGINIGFGTVNVGTTGNGNLIGHPTDINSISLSGINQHVGIFVNNTAGSSVINITENKIQGIYVNSPNSAAAFYGINTFAGLPVITGNTIGSATVPNSIRASSAGIAGLGTLGGMVISNPVSITPSIAITNNTIANLNVLDNGTNNGVFGILHVLSTVLNISANNIYNLSSFSSSATTNGVVSAAGIIFNAAAIASPGVSITQNNIYNIEATNTNSVSSVAAGIVMNAANSPVISRNRIYGIKNQSGMSSISTPAVAAGIIIASAANKVDVVNNQISIGNGQAGPLQCNGIWIQGTGTYVANVHYNTAVISGTGATGNVSSYAFLRGANGTTEIITPINAINNVFVNARTGGAAIQFATANQQLSGTTTGSGWNPALINYNFLASSNAAVGQWGATNCDFNLWKATAFSDGNSYSLTTGVGVGLLNISNLFTDIANGNTGVITTNAESWYLNGKGIAGTASNSINIDYAGTTRGTTLGFGTDIGSVEFNTATTPPAATASSSPALSTSTTYMFAGRPVATINWGSIGTVPTTVNLMYYTGVNAPNLVASKTQMNGYIAATSTGGSGFNYTMNMNYEPALLGNVSSEANLKIAMYKVSVWNFDGASTVNTTAKILNSTTFTGINNWNFTGTDVSNPLPVELVSLTATRSNDDVIVQWSTSSETNCLGFDVERSVDGKSFERVDFVVGAGNSNRVLDYKLTDQKAFAESGSKELYYRLKQLDKNGVFAYSDIVSVKQDADQELNTISAFPNPFEDGFSISFNAPDNGVVSLQITDLQGRKVAQKAISATRGMNVIDMNNLESMEMGVYVVTLSVNGESKVVKLIKQ